jgi:hypothetical protein
MNLRKNRWRMNKKVKKEFMNGKTNMRKWMNKLKWYYEPILEMNEWTNKLKIYK